MTVAVLEPTPLARKRLDSDRAARRHVMITAGVFASILLYLGLSFVQFDLASIARKWSPERASLFILDTYANKDHVEMRWDKPEEIEISFEGGFRSIYKNAPEWFTQGTPRTGSTVSFDNGGLMTIFGDRVLMSNWPDIDEDLVFRRDANGTPFVEGYRGLEDQLPEWIRITETKVEVRPSLYERLQVYTSKVEIHRYQIGWRFFWFDFDSPIRDYSFSEVWTLAFSDERIDPEMSNTGFILNEFLENDLWQHGTVLFAMVETILMALIGTLIASMVGLPLGFLAASNVSQLQGLRFVLRRLFDFLRGIDVLIWSLIFLRAFGPGLFTGIFAIAFTDTGTLGKLMSEAIENADKKQEEGVQSTGASRLQRWRYGIIPQIMPIFISQTLYYLESNTRGAVIIGAMGAGGIGLHFLGALQTGNDFENVAYIALLVLATVIAMDAFSSRLRRFLIGMDDAR
ncbi:MAG: phosphonate ABC transporter, permease protein PhnE [Alphaproteobacteria bacterium]|nr:phosphonate ABC transporter, permease protein PhnE [Alphaproteobacteria bacterium]